MREESAKVRECESAKVGIEEGSAVRTVAIAGLGLIGGSLARDLAARGVRVFAWDHDGAAMDSAIRQGIAHPGVWDDAPDVIVIALPVLAARTFLDRLIDRLGKEMDGVRLVTDMGSTKASIVRLAQARGIGDRFVGSHPLAGDHRSGWDASREGLFRGARVFLSPTPSTSDDAMRLARDLWTGVGALPEEVDADDHDARLAWTSHLPQLVSSALAQALAGEGIARGELGPGGRDVTRLAGSSPQMWAEVALDNAGALVPALEAMEARLREVRHLIANGEDAPLRDLLARAREWHRESG
ncbi:MAG: prephenate dehydrogenase/arogenate dehydrogenase family protein [Gemmatimonadetes bacterium]|nr:prephenate dehydrogenase/arogenate dehydrogenase family protein [Gemmatimonadota bacterium]